MSEKADLAREDDNQMGHDAEYDALPRRIKLDRMIPPELAIRNAILQVEELEPHPLLTDAVVLLQQAREKVADWYDGNNLHMKRR